LFQAHEENVELLNKIQLLENESAQKTEWEASTTPNSNNKKYFFKLTKKSEKVMNSMITDTPEGSSKKLKIKMSPTKRAK